MFLTVLLLKYFFDHHGFTSSGAIGALVQGLLAKELWKRGLPKRLADEGVQEVGLKLTQAWKLVEAGKSGDALKEEEQPEKGRNSGMDNMRRYEEAKEERRRRCEQRAKAKAAQQASQNGAEPIAAVEGEEGVPDLGNEGWTTQERPEMPVISTNGTAQGLLVDKFNIALQLLQSAVTELQASHVAFGKAGQLMVDADHAQKNAQVGRQEANGLSRECAEVEALAKAAPHRRCSAFGPPARGCEERRTR
ncbi:hypothetical protein COCOBI_10-2790 [Coccomyxa sp. Obi]|nr:hypothetical protein COCOBI_10-2790 [Coccomyxa sp. Obi]